MDAKSIREYAKIMKDMGLTVLEINTNDGKTSRIETIRLERNIPQAAQTAPTAVATVIPQVVNDPAAPVVSEAVAEAPGKDNADGLISVTSPMVGVFYTSPSENAAPYVSVGDKVKKGDVLCIIEAMKLMNEITAEEDGVIAEVCVNNGQVVDFGHVLFKLSK